MNLRGYFFVTQKSGWRLTTTPGLETHSPPITSLARKSGKRETVSRSRIHFREARNVIRSLPDAARGGSVSAQFRKHLGETSRVRRRPELLSNWKGDPLSPIRSRRVHDQQPRPVNIRKGPIRKQRRLSLPPRRRARLKNARPSI
jgi:hypothetical protein